MPRAIGIDIGGTKIAAGLVDLETGDISHRIQIPTNPARGGEAILNDVAAMAKKIRGDAVAIGIGVPELVDREGQIASDATLHWQNLSVRERLSKILPTTIEADVRAAARAESRFGAGSNCKNFLYVTIGTGISCCLMIDGQPYLGANGLTGTFASARTVFPLENGRLVESSILESFSSGPALAERFGSTITTAEVISFANSGNPRAKEVVDTAARVLGSAVAQLVNTLDPEIVILGGGLGCAPGLFYTAVEKQFREHLWSEHHFKIPLLHAKLGPDAGIIGAALAAS